MHAHFLHQAQGGLPRTPIWPWLISLTWMQPLSINYSVLKFCLYQPGWQALLRGWEENIHYDLLSPENCRARYRFCCVLYTYCYSSPVGLVLPITASILWMKKLRLSTFQPQSHTVVELGFTPMFSDSSHSFFFLSFFFCKTGSNLYSFHSSLGDSPLLPNHLLFPRAVSPSLVHEDSECFLFSSNPAHILIRSTYLPSSHLEGRES